MSETIKPRESEMVSEANVKKMLHQISRALRARGFALMVDLDGNFSVEDLNLYSGVTGERMETVPVPPGWYVSKGE